MTDRIGTCYFDEATGEYVMPADFAGDEDLRWKAERHANVHENVTFTLRESCGDHEAPSPDVADRMVPLAEQEARYERYWMREVMRIERDLKRPTYLQHIHDLGLARLRAGFDTFGDAMYRFTDCEAQANEDEEVCDRIVYGTAHD